MAQFIVRVELHRATEADYELLHSEMRRRGFSRTITNGIGTAYHLPSAMYYMRGTNTSAVHAAAKAAADVTGKSSWILTTEMSSASFNLALVR